MVGKDGDLELTLVKHHRHFVTIDIHHLSSFTLVFTFGDSHQIARLKVLGHVTDVHLEQIELGHINWLKSDHAAFNFNDRAAHTCALTLVDAYLVTFHVDSLAALPQGLFNYKVNLSVLVIIEVIVILVASTIAQASLEALQLFVRGLDIGT